MRIYIVNGAPGVGKTTFETAVRAKVGKDWVFILSVITPVKQAAKYLGWTGAKDPKGRKFLSDLKDIADSSYDLSYKYISSELSKIQKSFEIYDIPTDNVVVFIDAREPWDIHRLSLAYKARSILIKRASRANEEILNHADRDVDNYDYDLYIELTEDLDWLDKKVEKFIKDEGIKNPSR